jgi:SAM-dependent methyltransferase
VVVGKPRRNRFRKFRRRGASFPLSANATRKDKKEGDLAMTSHAVSEDAATYRKFGEYYDAIYADRDYGKDVHLLLQLLQEFASQGPLRILELGCGTGAHTLPLAEKGHEIVGVDQSPAMLAAARRKAASAANLKLSFQKADIRALRFQHEFDACISMFGCMSYLITSDDLKQTLHGVARSLSPQGVFIFDFWNESAVTKQKPSVRRKEIVLNANERLVRTAIPEVDWRASLCSIRYQVSLYENQTVKESFEETHNIRFFRRREMTAELEGTGFEVLDIRTPDGNHNDLDESWFLVAIARRMREARRR